MFQNYSGYRIYIYIYIAFTKYIYGAYRNGCFYVILSIVSYMLYLFYSNIKLVNIAFK